MKSNNQVLRAHYAMLLRKAATWSGLFALISAMFMPVQASAAYGSGQLTNRSTTVSTSAAAATGVTYTTKFTFGTTGQTVGSLYVELCDSPLPNAGTCANTAGTAGTAGSTGASFASATSATVTVNSGTWTNAGTCTLGTHTGNHALITCTAGLITLTPTVTVVINGVTNPTNTNRNYALHMSTYTDTGGVTGTDYGAMALSTTSSLAVSANVQESLSFCVGTSGGASSDCTTITGTTVSIGSGTDNVLSSTAGTGATSLMYVSTNASSGYVVSYTTSSSSSGNFASGSNVFGNASSQTLSSCTSGGVDCFGINLAANTTTSTPAGAIGAAPTGGLGTAVANSGYATADSFKFVPGTTAQPVLQQTTPGPTTKTTATVSYVAQAGLTTKPGAYSTTFNYVATGTF